jgi:hypothetical protein
MKQPNNPRQRRFRPDGQSRLKEANLIIRVTGALAWMADPRDGKSSNVEQPVCPKHQRKRDRSNRHLTHSTDRQRPPALLAQLANIRS